MNERPVGEMLTCLLFGAVGAFCLWIAVHIFLRGETVFTTNSGRVTYVATGNEAILCGVFALVIGILFLCGGWLGFRYYSRW